MKAIGPLCAASLLACSSPIAPPPTGAGCVDFAKVAAAAPSFKTDVVPIFQRSCAFKDCHSSEVANPPGEGLKLGRGATNGMPLPQMSDAEIAAVHDGVVNRASARSSLVTVAPGDPGKSWLIAKVAYQDLAIDCAAVAASCAGKGCGDPMPRGESQLSQKNRDILVNWVKNGAKND